MKTFIALAAALLCAATVQASPSMTAKHKMECTACHQKGEFKPVQKEVCQTCHKPFSGNYMLEGGKANPHVSIHYAPDTLDCNLCHREHAKSQNYCEACHADGLGFKVP